MIVTGKALQALLAFMALMICFTAPLIAAEPVAVILEGIEGDVLANVTAALALPQGLVGDGKSDQLWLERFVQQADAKVRTAMESFGYYSARATVTIEQANPGEVRLRVRVEPGELVRVTEALLVLHGPGAEEPTLKKLAAAFPLTKGSVLLQQQYELAKNQLLSLAQELGYLDADFAVHEIRIAESMSTARIRLELETGPRYFFAGTRIEGAHDYPEAFLRRYLAFKPGEAFSYARLGETQLNFMNSERFREVNLMPERAATREFRIPVLVQLKPAPSKRVCSRGSAMAQTRGEDSTSVTMTLTSWIGATNFTQISSLPSVSRGLRPATSCRTRWT